MKESENSKFNRFWESNFGQSIILYIESSCMPENNDELAQDLLQTIYERNYINRLEVRNYLLGCQKSIQRILATI